MVLSWIDAVVFKDRENHRSYSEHANNLLVPCSKRANWRVPVGWTSPMQICCGLRYLCLSDGNFARPKWWCSNSSTAIAPCTTLPSSRRRVSIENVCKRRELEVQFFKMRIKFRITDSPGFISTYWYISCIIYGYCCTCLNDFVNITSLCT